VVVPIEEYQQLRQAMQEQQVNEEFDAARARYLARREAGAIRYVSHEEGAAAWACHPGELSGQLGDSDFRTRRRASSAAIPALSLRSRTLLAGSPMSCARRSRSLTSRTDLRRLRAVQYRVLYTIDEERRVVQIDHVARLL